MGARLSRTHPYATIPCVSESELALTPSRAAWRALSLRNFRAFESTELIELAPITLLLGKNSSGKTTILTAPLLLRQLLHSSDVRGAVPLSGPDVDLGSYKDLVHLGELKRDIELTVAFSTSARTIPTAMIRDLGIETFLERGYLHLTLHWNRREASAQTSRLVFSESPDPEGHPIAEFQRSGPGRFRFDVPRHQFSREIRGRDLSLSTLKFLDWDIGETDRRSRYLSLLPYILNLCLEEICESLIHVGPLRDMPSRAYRQDQLGLSGRGSGNRDAVSIMAREQAVIARTSRALESLGMAEKVDIAQPAPGYVAVILTDLLTGRRRNLADVGFGVSQVLPILVVLAEGAPDSLALIEQPELHLHPASQGELADVLIELASASGQTLLIETHSEHILLRLQRRVAEGSLSPQSVAVYLTDSGVVKRAMLDDIGQLDTSFFPEGFFEEEWEDAVAAAKARARRRE